MVPDDVKEYAKTIANKVFFAGEATTDKHLSNVQGAYISAQRVVEEILR